MRGSANRLRLPPADSHVTAVGEIRGMPLPADAGKLPPEGERFLDRFDTLATAHWLVAAGSFGAARQHSIMTRFALESLTVVATEASRSP
jgi:hypothetical protein